MSYVRSIRLAPPIVISEEDLQKTLDIIKSSLEDLDTVRPHPDLPRRLFELTTMGLQVESIPGAEPHHH
jgi:hypothetical protein